MGGSQSTCTTREDLAISKQAFDNCEASVRSAETKAQSQSNVPKSWFGVGGRKRKTTRKRHKTTFKSTFNKGFSEARAKRKASRKQYK